RYRLGHFTFGLDAGVPPIGSARQGDVPGLTQNFSAVAVAHPAQFGQLDAAVDLVDLELLAVGVTKTLYAALALETRKAAALGKEVPVGTLEVLERMLQRVTWRLLEPRGLQAVAPRSQGFRQFHIAD